MQKHIEYIFAGGPLHGQTISRLRFNEDSRVAPSFAGDATLRSPRICASYRHANNGSLRVAAKHRRSSGGTACYIVLHPHATGEQFLTIFAA